MSIQDLRLQAAFTQKTALKVISGLNNFDQSQVLAVAKAAQAGGATFVDIAADSGLIRQVRQAIWSGCQNVFRVGFIWLTYVRILMGGTRGEDINAGPVLHSAMSSDN